MRDIWPLTLVKLGGYSKKHPFIRLLQWIEDQAYQKAAYVFSNLPNAVEHMQSRGMNKDKFTWIANGVSLEELDNKSALPKEVLEQIPSGKFILGYTKEGIIQIVITLVSCGFAGIIPFIEGIIYLTKSDEEFYNTYQVGRKGWF